MTLSSFFILYYTDYTAPWPHRKKNREKFNFAEQIFVIEKISIIFAEFYFASSGPKLQKLPEYLPVKISARNVDGKILPSRFKI